MILPIYTYGQPILKKVAKPIDQNYPDLSDLISNMWETMYNAHGVGLAAPQIGHSIRLFIVDSKQIEGSEDTESDFVGLKSAFINPQKIDENGELWDYEEGCLSIPNIRGDVRRHEVLHISYFDENFIEHKITLDDINARVVQHEYDHIEGKLFTEYLKPLKKRRIKRKLDAMKQGFVDADYAVRPYRG